MSNFPSGMSDMSFDGPTPNEARIFELEAQNDCLREALKFYATDANYCSVLKFGSCGHRLDWEFTPVLVDDGAIARAVLENQLQT